MELTLTIGGTSYAVNLTKPHDLSVPVRFDGKGPQAFGAPAASKKPFTEGTFVGDVNKGGSCNCDMLHFAPHLHGTHTESVGHLTKTPLPVSELIEESLIPATLITITPSAANGEAYDPPLAPTDKVITEKALSAALGKADESFLAALIIRTNSQDTFFTHQAMHYLVARSVRHLLVDMASVDKQKDEGKLSSHRIFWGVKPGAEPSPSPKTITELIAVDKSVADGQYLLNLQVAPLAVDASPSRPLLYEITRR